MKINVQYTAQLRTALGKTEDQVDVPEPYTLASLLALLAQRGGDAARPHLVDAAGRAQPSLLLVVNDAAVSAALAATTELRDGDRVLLLPPIAGG